MKKRNVVSKKKNPCKCDELKQVQENFEKEKTEAVEYYSGVVNQYKQTVEHCKKVIKADGEIIIFLGVTVILLTITVVALSVENKKLKAKIK